MANCNFFGLATLALEDDKHINKNPLLVLHIFQKSCRYQKPYSRVAHKTVWHKADKPHIPALPYGSAVTKG